VFPRSRELSKIRLSHGSYCGEWTICSAKYLLFRTRYLNRSALGHWEQHPQMYGFSSSKIRLWHFLISCHFAIYSVFLFTFAPPRGGPIQFVHSVHMHKVTGELLCREAFPKLLGHEPVCSGSRKVFEMWFFNYIQIKNQKKSESEKTKQKLKSFFL
jgi:hypothetical protein